MSTNQLRNSTNYSSDVFSKSTISPISHTWSGTPARAAWCESMTPMAPTVETTFLESRVSDEPVPPMGSERAARASGKAGALGTRAENGGSGGAGPPGASPWRPP